MTIGGFPLYCVSKLQTYISLSTLEAEYISLSRDMRDLQPLRRFLQEVGTQLNIYFALSSIMQSTVIEENNGALELATSLSTTTSTRHISVKYHFFI